MCGTDVEQTRTLATSLTVEWWVGDFPAAIRSSRVYKAVEPD
jgi:hypothetical protein